MTSRGNTIIIPEIEGNVITKALYKFVYSQKEKEDKKFEVVKHFANAVRSNELDPKLIEKFIENMNIHMGRWESTSSNARVNITLQDGKKINFGRDKTRNHPYLDIISQSIATDFNTRPTHIKIIDTSKHAMKLRKQKEREYVKQRLNELFVQPLLKQASMDADKKYGNPLNLGEEALMQRNSEINNFVMKNLSEDVKKMLDNTTLDSEKLQKRLFDICYERNDMDFKYEQAVDYMLTTSVVAFRKEFGFGEVYFSPVSPCDLTYELSYGSIFFEDGLHANVRRYLSPMEIIQEGYHIFKNKDWKDIEKLFVTIPSSSILDANIVHQRTSRSVDGAYRIDVPVSRGGIDLAAMEYRNMAIDARESVIFGKMLKQKMTEVFHDRRVGIIVDHPTWRWNAKAKLVTRIIDGKKKQFIRGETYEQNKIYGDIDVQDTIIPQTYQAKVFADTIYTEMKPVECQYEDPFDISRPKLNVYGAQFMTIDGDVKNLTIFDPSKIYQKRFSEAHEAIGDAIAYDLGSVMFINKKSFESMGGPEGFFDMLFKLRTVVTEDAMFGQQNNSNGNVSVQEFSSGAKIGEYINLAEYYTRLMVKMMRYTEAKLGNSGQYENKMNIQASLSAPDRQMGRMHSILLKIKSNIHVAMAKAAFVAYENNDELLSNYLEEDLLIHYKEHYDELLGTKFDVKTTSSLEEYENLRQYKALLVNYMSTGGDLDNLADALESKDMAKAKELGKASTLLKEKKDSEARRHEKELAELNARTMENIEKQRQDREDGRFALNIDSKREQAFL